MIRHSLMASTRSEKLSLRRMSDADSFATSVPVMPIATPMSAFLSAGASLIPSPVTDTTSHCFSRSLTILSLSSGDVLENMT